MLINNGAQPKLQLPSGLENSLIDESCIMAIKSVVFLFSSFFRGPEDIQSVSKKWQSNYILLQLKMALIACVSMFYIQSSY